MFEVNVPKLIGRMHERGYNKSSLADACQINRNTLAAYIKNPEKMPYHIIDTIATILCDTPSDASSIFFALELTQKESYAQQKAT